MADEIDITDIEKAILNQKDYFKITKPSKLWYIIPSILIIIAIGTPIVIYFGLKSAILTFISTIIAIPILLISLIVLIGRLIIRKQVIYNKIMPRLTSNYIIAVFFNEHKQTQEKVCILNKDGITFNVGEQLYLVDINAIWKRQGHPTSYYLPNLPNPLLFDFQENPQKFVKELLMENKDKPEGSFYLDKNGRIVDISYSSDNLQLFKKDKIFADLHRSSEQEKMLLAMIGIIALAFITIMIMAFFRKSEVIVQTGETAKTTAKQLLIIGLFMLRGKKNDI